MRNDSRPIFEHSPASPLGGHAERTDTREPHDSRDTIAHGRESHVVHEKSEADDSGREDDQVRSG